MRIVPWQTEVPTHGNQCAIAIQPHSATAAHTHKVATHNLHCSVDLVAIKGQYAEHNGTSWQRPRQKQSMSIICTAWFVGMTDTFLWGNYHAILSEIEVKLANCLAGKLYS